MSIIVLALAALSLINIIFELFFGELSEALNNTAAPAGSPENIVFISQIFILVVSLLLILPQVYIGVKGLKVAKEPDTSRGHIIWGIILIVFTFASLLTPLLAFIQGDGDAFGNVSELCSLAVDVAVLFEYVRNARAVRNAA